MDQYFTVGIDSEGAIYEVTWSMTPPSDGDRKTELDILQAMMAKSIDLLKVSNDPMKMPGYESFMLLSFDLTGQHLGESLEECISESISNDVTMCNMHAFMRNTGEVSLSAQIKNKTVKT